LEYPKIIKRNKHKHDIKQEQFRQTIIFKNIIEHMADDQQITKSYRREQKLVTTRRNQQKIKHTTDEIVYDADNVLITKDQEVN